MEGDREGALRVPRPVRHLQDVAPPLDRRVLPDRGAELLGMVRELGLGEAGLARRPGRRAGFVEALLSRVDRVGVHPGVGPRVAPPRTGLLGEPEVLPAHESPVRHQDARVDYAARPVQVVGPGPRQAARKDVRANQRLSPCSFADWRIMASRMAVFVVPPRKENMEARARREGRARPGVAPGARGRARDRGRGPAARHRPGVTRDDDHTKAPGRDAPGLLAASRGRALACPWRGPHEGAVGSDVPSAEGPTLAVLLGQKLRLVRHVRPI